MSKVRRFETVPILSLDHVCLFTGDLREQEQIMLAGMECCGGDNSAPLTMVTWLVVTAVGVMTGNYGDNYCW